MIIDPINQIGLAPDNGAKLPILTIDNCTRQWHLLTNNNITTITARDPINQIEVADYDYNETQIPNKKLKKRHRIFNHS